jgi:hypothetical protein
MASRSIIGTTEIIDETGNGELLETIKVLVGSYSNNGVWVFLQKQSDIGMSIKETEELISLLQKAIREVPIKYII